MFLHPTVGCFSHASESLQDDRCVDGGLVGDPWTRLTYYKTILQAGCVPNGLEIWAASQALGVHLNFVQRGQLWLSCTTGINRDDFTLMYLEDSIVFYDRLDSDTTSKTPTHTTQGWPKTKECSPRATPLDFSISKSVLPQLCSQCCPKVVDSGKNGSTKVATGVKSIKFGQGELGKNADCVKSIRKTTDVEYLKCDFIARSVQGLYHHMKSVHPQACPYQCNVCGQWFRTPPWPLSPWEFCAYTESPDLWLVQF